MAEVLVVGAGAAGLAAAATLAASGHAVVVVDKGRGVGGRLATRRIGEARLDHGAQFFTVRSEEFTRLARRWLAEGVAREWCRGFRNPPDGHPRYVGAAGMTTLAKAMAAGLDVRVGVRLARIGRGDDGRWEANDDQGRAVADRHGAPGRFDAVVATAPVPQTLEMLAAGDVEPGAVERLGAIRYEPTLAVLVVLAGPSGLPAPGGVQMGADDLAWIGDNQAKGISPQPAVTVHASGAYSADRFDDDPDAVLDDLIDRARPLIGAAGVVDRQLARWRYATPVVLDEERCLLAAGGPHPLVCAGDAFGEAKVEGALRSGWAAAAAVGDRLGGTVPGPGE